MKLELGYGEISFSLWKSLYYSYEQPSNKRIMYFYDGSYLDLTRLDIMCHEAWEAYKKRRCETCNGKENEDSQEKR